MLRTILIVGSGGFIGSVMRYLVQIFVEKGLSSGVGGRRGQRSCGPVARAAAPRL